MIQNEREEINNIEKISTETESATDDTNSEMVEDVLLNISKTFDKTRLESKCVELNEELNKLKSSQETSKNSKKTKVQNRWKGTKYGIETQLNNLVSSYKEYTQSIKGVGDITKQEEKKRLKKVIKKPLKYLDEDIKAIKKVIGNTSKPETSEETREKVEKFLEEVKNEAKKEINTKKKWLIATTTTIVIILLIFGVVFPFHGYPMLAIKEFTQLQEKWSGSFTFEKGILMRAPYTFHDENTIIIPETFEGVEVVGINDNVFADPKFSNITSVMIPSSVKKIGANAFSGCSLPYYYYDEIEEKIIKANKDSNIPGIQIVGIDDGSKFSPYVYNEKELKYNSAVWIVGSRGDIGDLSVTLDQFFNRNYVDILKKNTEDGIIVVGVADGAFEGANLGNVSIENLKYIGENAFKGSSITSLSVSGTGDNTSTIVTEALPANAFKDCNNFLTPLYTITTETNILEAGTITQYNKEKIAIGTEIILNATPNAGYTFVGWREGEKEVNTNNLAMTCGNKTFTAIWEENTYSVILDSNGGNMLETSIDITYKQEDCVPVPTRLGYVFGGWQDADGNAITDENGAIIRWDLVGGWSTSANVVLEAKWEAASYRLIFNVNGGSISQEWLSVTYMQPTGILPEPTRAGYAFVGWVKDAEDTISILEGRIEEWNMAKDGTIMATWEAVFTKENNKITGLTEYGKTLSSINVPAIMDGESITILGENSFKDTLIEEVYINEGIVRIEDYAFYNCDNLTNVSFPSSINYIGGWCFENCNELKEIEIPENITTIENYTFKDCEKLENVVFNYTIKEIKTSAFENTKITSIALPVTLESIGGWTFKNCSKLTTISYAGTWSEWRQISKGTAWNEGVNSNFNIYYAIEQKFQVRFINNTGISFTMPANIVVVASDDAYIILPSATSNNELYKFKSWRNNQQSFNAGTNIFVGQNMDLYLEEDKSDDYKDYAYVKTEQDLIDIRNNMYWTMDDKILLEDDVELTTEWYPLGWAGGDKYYPFTGEFDGRGFTISGLKRESVLGYDENNEAYFGFFAKLDGATIKNLSLNLDVKIPSVDATTKSYIKIGGIAGAISNSKISCCSVNGTINAGNDRTARRYMFVGGIAGESNGENLIEYTKNATAITANHRISFVGGLIGRVCSNDKTKKLVVKYSYNTGDLDVWSFSQFASFTYTGSAGGIVGHIGDVDEDTIETDATSKVDIKYCYSYGKIRVANSYYVAIGGLIGRVPDKNETEKEIEELVLYNYYCAKLETDTDNNYDFDLYATRRNDFKVVGNHLTEEEMKAGKTVGTLFEYSKSSFEQNGAYCWVYKAGELPILYWEKNR